MPEYLDFLILFGVGIAAGVINVMAGGGSSLTLPALIFLGLDSAAANGTNRVGILIQSLFATLSFRKEKILQSYVRAVVRQAISEAQGLLNEGKFYKAQQVVETAHQTINVHRATVGEELSGQYETRLEQLIGQITRGRARWLGSWEGRGAWKL